MAFKNKKLLISAASWQEMTVFKCKTVFVQNDSSGGVSLKQAPPRSHVMCFASSAPFCWFRSSNASPVDGLGCNAELAQPQLSQSELQVLWEFPALCQNLFQPLSGHLGEAEVTDGRVVVVHDVAGARGGDVALGAGCHSVFARIQQPPVVAISN